MSSRHWLSTAPLIALLTNFFRLFFVGTFSRSCNGNGRLYFFKSSLILLNHERGSHMVFEINMGVCPRLEFDNIVFINCLGYNFYVYGAFELLCNSIAYL